MKENHVGKIKCSVCGTRFMADSAKKYLVTEPGSVSLFSRTDPAVRECFDCPQCGCQNRVNTRVVDEVLEGEVADA